MEGTSSSLAFFENVIQGPGWSPTSKRQEGDNVANLRESVESPPGWRCCSVVGSWRQGSPWWIRAGSQPENRKTRMWKDWRVSISLPDTVNVPQTRWIYFTSPSGKRPSENICKGEELSTRRQWLNKSVCHIQSRPGEHLHWEWSQLVTVWGLHFTINMHHGNIACHNALFN